MVKKHSLVVMNVKVVYHQYIRVYVNLLLTPEIVIKKSESFLGKIRKYGRGYNR